jgi:hypothetical protein
VAEAQSPDTARELCVSVEDEMADELARLTGVSLLLCRDRALTEDRAAEAVARAGPDAGGRCRAGPPVPPPHVDQPRHPRPPTQGDRAGGDGPLVVAVGDELHSMLVAELAGKASSRRHLSSPWRRSAVSC